MKRNQGAAVLFAILIFGCGALAGAFAQRYFTSAIVSARSAEDFRQHYVSEMQSKLNLSTLQLNRLEVILDETREKYRAVRNQYHPAMMQIKNEQVSRVESILTPEQIPAYRRLVAEREQRFREQEEHDRQQDLKREASHRAAQANH